MEAWRRSDPGAVASRTLVLTRHRKNIMGYAIVGFGKIGQALAHAFARKNIDVAVASRRQPEALAPQARAIGPTVVAKSLRDALEADTIILAVPFDEHGEVAKALPSLRRSGSSHTSRRRAAPSETATRTWRRHRYIASSPPSPLHVALPPFPQSRFGNPSDGSGRGPRNPS
jgi:hypothetical protein